MWISTDLGFGSELYEYYQDANRVGVIQSFQNGTFAYWFNHCQVGIQNDPYWQKTLGQVMRIVEFNWRKNLG